MAEKNKLMKVLKDDLKSTNDEIVLEALEATRSKGQAELIPLISDLLLHDNPEITLKAGEVLGSLKDSAALEPLMEAMQDAKFKNVRHKMLSALWNSSLQPNQYLFMLVEIAVKGTYMECIECHTIIESMEGEFPDDQIMESQMLLNDYFSEHRKPTDRSELLKDILVAMERH